MFNILLDSFPDEWNGYKLNTDFRVGIQMTQASEDPELSTYEKLQVMTMLLFHKEHPETAEECTQAIEWFFTAWNMDHHEKSDEKGMDFDADQGRIYSAFLAQYRIDLNYEKMHFWKFMHLLSNLEECSFTRVIDIRTKQITTKMSREEITMYANAKKTYALETAESKELQDEKDYVTQKFLQAMGKG